MVINHRGADPREKEDTDEGTISRNSSEHQNISGDGGKVFSSVQDKSSKNDSPIDAYEASFQFQNQSQG